jgi:hypothetical protein
VLREMGSPDHPVISPDGHPIACPFVLASSRFEPRPAIFVAAALSGARALPHHRAMKLTLLLTIPSVLLAPQMCAPPDTADVPVNRALSMAALSRHVMSAQDIPQPELVEPGVISTPQNEFDITFTPDGDTMYYGMSSPGTSYGVSVIVRSVRRSGHWTAPVVAPFSGQYNDADPSISPDGKRLFFASTRPVDGKPKKPSDTDIWVVDRTATGWSEPTNLGPPVNSTVAEYYPVVTADGTLYFFTQRPDSKGHYNMYRSHLVNGHYGAPENLGPTLNGTFDNTDMTLAPDQSYMIFTSYGRPDGVGSLDIPGLGNGDLYISFNRHGVWTTPKNLGAPINTAALEYAPRISPDGQYLYFTSNRGFEYQPFSRPLSMDEWRDSLTSIRNGNGNIYRVPLAPLLAAMRRTGP